MTFNELAAIFASDDLNPNNELIFYGNTCKYVIDDVFDDNEFVSIHLKEKQ